MAELSFTVWGQAVLLGGDAEMTVVGAAALLGNKARLTPRVLLSRDAVVAGLAAPLIRASGSSVSPVEARRAGLRAKASDAVFLQALRIGENCFAPLAGSPDTPVCVPCRAALSRTEAPPFSLRGREGEVLPAIFAGQWPLKLWFIGLIDKDDDSGIGRVEEDPPKYFNDFAIVFPKHPCPCIAARFDKVINIGSLPCAPVEEGAKPIRASMLATDLLHRFLEQPAQRILILGVLPRHISVASGHAWPWGWQGVASIHKQGDGAAGCNFVGPAGYISRPTIMIRELKPVVHISIIPRRAEITVSPYRNGGSDE